MRGVSGYAPGVERLRWRATADVVVVGAGPTGLMVAGELALAGAAVAVVERYATPSGQSRGGGVNPRTSEVLAMRGLLEAVTERAIPRESAGSHFAGLPVPLDARPWRTLPGRSRHSAGPARAGSRGSLAGTGRRGAPQHRADRLDQRRGRRRGRRVRPRWCGCAAGPLSRGMRWCAQHGSEADRRGLSGAGWDAGRGQRGYRAGRDVGDGAAAVVTHQYAYPHRRGLLDADAPLEKAGERTGLYRVVFGGPEQETLSRQAAVTAAEVARALTAVHGPPTELRRLLWGSRFSDATRQVTAYRCGRILFAGDAAHIHSPIGGQGLNLGIQDAVNLGWKLAAHVQGRAPAGLLDSYHTERHPVAARVLATTRAQGVLMSPPPDADDVRALREIVIDLARLPDANRYLAGLMCGLDLRSGRGLLLELGRPPLHPASVPDSVEWFCA